MKLRETLAEFIANIALFVVLCVYTLFVNVVTLGGFGEKENEKIKKKQ